MPDTLTPEQRKRCMQAVKCRDTSIELIVARAFRRLGLRPKRYVAGLPGRPDFVFTRARLIVFVDGDFWHGWQFPKWRDRLTPYWLAKIERNRKRDAKNHRILRRQGWKVVRVWEHQVFDDAERIARNVALILRRMEVSRPLR